MKFHASSSSPGGPGLRAAAALATCLAVGPGVAATNPLVPFLDTTLHGGLAVGATCINYAPVAEGGPIGGVLRLDTVPPGATVIGAWLYWSVLTDQSPVPAGSPTVNGTPVIPVHVGTVEATPCFPQARTGVFRADVESVVDGNGDYALSGFLGTGTPDFDLTEGATLFVLYCDPARPLTDVVIWEGADVITDTLPPFSQDFGGFLADPAGPVEALIGAAAGNGQNRFPGDADRDPFVLNGVDLDLLHPEILAGDLCQPDGLYDLTVFDVSSHVAPGSTTATLAISAVSDCYSIGAIALAVTTDQTRTDDACAAISCSFQLVPPPRVASCGGAAGSLDLSAVAVGCPTGPTDKSSQAVDPVALRDATASSDFAPGVSAVGATLATVSFQLGGDTDLVACVEVALVDPVGGATVLKAAGQPIVSSYDVTSLITSTGTWSLRLTELPGCGTSTSSTAVLTAGRLVMEEDAGLPVVEFRVERFTGDVVSDWSTELVVPVPPLACPATEDLVILARCAFDGSCAGAVGAVLACGDPQAAFTDVATCGSQRACFQDDTSGGEGRLTFAWDFAGEGTSPDAATCHDFLSPPPWSVTLDVTDELDCTSSVTRSIAPPAADPPLEPSARDLLPSVEPLRVARVAGGLRLTWEDLGATQVDDVYRGFIGTWYSHGDVGACGVTGAAVTLPLEAGDLYFLVGGVACDGTVSSLGRRSDGVERPPADPACR